MNPVDIPRTLDQITAHVAALTARHYGKMTAESLDIAATVESAYAAIQCVDELAYDSEDLPVSASLAITLLTGQAIEAEIRGKQ